MDGLTPLHLACRNLQPKAVAASLAAGANPADRDRQGLSAHDHLLRGVAYSAFDAFWYERREHRPKFQGLDWDDRPVEQLFVEIQAMLSN
jgi:ankyrin repeat protein